MSDRTPTVWLMQEPHPDGRGPDLRTARGYGNIRFVFGRNPTPSVDVDGALDHVMSLLGEIREGDYVLDTPGCDPIALFLFGMAVGSLHEPPALNWLRWDRRTDAQTGERTRHGYYTPVSIPAL